METVELKSLKYDPVLQDENSAFSIVLSSVLKSKVSPYFHHVDGPELLFVNSVKLYILTFLQIKNVFAASSISHHYNDCSIVAYG